jgi:hypothetical protein
VIVAVSHFCLVLIFEGKAVDYQSGALEVKPLAFPAIIRAGQKELTNTIAK